MNIYKTIFSLFFVFSVALCAKESKKLYQLIYLKDVDYKIVNRVCRPWLGKDPVMVYEKKRNSILVYATPETIVKIRKFIDNTASPDVNIRIDLDRVGVKNFNDSKFSFKSPPVKTYKYKNGKRVKNYSRQKTINFRSSRDITNYSSKQFIVTKSGYPASLWVGKTTVDPSWKRYAKPKKEIVIQPGGYAIETGYEDIKMVNVGMSLQVLPRYLSNGMIEVEVYPEITEIVGKGKRKNVKITSLSSKILVKSGARINIGGVISNKKNAYTKLFGPDFFSRKGIKETMNMYITAKAIPVR